MPIGTSSTKIIESYIKPFINFFVNGMVIVTDLLRSFFLLQCFDLCGSAVLISTTYVEYVIALQSFESCIYICGEYTADYIPQMRYVVYIW